MKKQLFFSFIVLLWIQMEAPAQDVIVKNYPGIESLDIEGGPLEVSYQGNPAKTDIEVTAFLGPEKDQEKELVFITVGNVLKLAYKPEQKSINNYRGPKKYIQITGPENMVLEIKNSSGQIKVDHVTADKTRLSISSGHISASDIGGNLILRGSSGNIQVNHITGSVSCSITSGMSTIEEVEGDLDFASTSGRLSASNIKGRVDAKLTSGSVNLDNIGELGELAVSSGNVKAKAAGLGKATSFRGSSGSFSVTTTSDLHAFNYDLQASSGSLRVGDASKGKRLVIQNGASGTVKGNISSGRISIEN